MGDGNATDVGDAATIDTATTTGATTDAVTDGSSTPLPIASSMSKTPKRKKITTNYRHQSNLRFMNHIHEHVWTNHIVGYCKVWIYGNSDANIETACPTFCGWETLQSVKKGISFLHPEKDTDWNTHNKTGNPTRSVVVRNLMRKANDQKIAGNGAASKERGPFVKEEFEQTIHNMLEANNNLEERLFAPNIILVVVLMIYQNKSV